MILFKSARGLTLFFNDDVVSVLFSKGGGGFHVKNTNTTTASFPRGSKKRKSNYDDKHDHGQEKRRPSTLC